MQIFEVGAIILISDKVDHRAKKITGDKATHYIMIKEFTRKP